jgi:hypothetical protein
MERANEVLNELEGLTRSILEIPEDDRVLIYQKIHPLILNLRGELKKAPNRFAEEKLGELEWHLTTIAHLGEPDGDTDEQHCEYSLGLLKDLRGSLGFAA